LGSIRVVADDLNNSILVWGTRSEFNRIETALKRLDLPLTQVLIEASIIEVTLNDDLKYGLKWAFSGDAQSGYSGSGSVGSAPSITQGFSYTLKNAAGLTKATLSALADKSLVKMLSNPSLMVLDNHTATIAVGDQIPVRTGTTTTPNGSGDPIITNTIQYKDTGVNLAVTPSVTAGNVVAMQIDQTVTDAGSPDTSTTAGGGERPFLQRQISSKVAVRSGESIVLGGLMKNNQTNRKTGVPLLQDIPLIGNLFAENASTGVRTELIVIITPRVVRTDVDIREVSEDLRERLKGLRAIEVDMPASRSPVDTKMQVTQPVPAQPN
jgi:general secretion pathway protein D